jgi:hypothetical protein
MHSNTQFEQIWIDLNSNRNGFEFELNKSKGKKKNLLFLRASLQPMVTVVH